MPSPHNPLIALALSLAMPGLGQLYNGERAKGIAMLVIVLGMGASCLAFRSLTTFVLIGAVYLVVLIPSASDAYRVASGQPSRFSGESVWYVVTMLLAVGPFALPLLWQSRRFSSSAKIMWTIAVVLISVLCIVMVAALGPMMDKALRQYRALP